MDARHDADASGRRIIRLRLALAASVLAFALLSGCTHRPPSADFTLTDDRGDPWSLSAQRGRIVLLDFGFTHCADTCPLALAKLVRVVKAAESNPSDATIAFVTVDPARDGVSAMHRYVQKFDTTGRLVGLTGTPAQIDAVERDYHVWAQRVPGAHGRQGYDVAHSAAIYYIDRSGAQRALRDDDDSEAALGTTLRELL